MKIKIKVVRQFEDNDKIYFPDEIYLAPSEFARRFVSRGDAKFLKDDSEIIEESTPKVSIVILVKDALKYLKKCVKSLRTYTDNYELIIVDNGSNSETKKWLSKIDCKLIENKINKGISYGWNQAIKEASCDYICFLNSDTLLSPNWLDKLMRGFKYSDKVGIVGPSTCSSKTVNSPQVISYKNKADQNEVNKIASRLKEDYIETSIVGFCFIVSRKVIESIGVFDWKRYGIGGYEEMDYFWRAVRKGFKLLWCKDSYVHHYGNKTTIEMGIDPLAIREKNKAIFEERKKDPILFIENDYSLKTKLFEKLEEEFTSIIIPVKDTLDYLKKCIESIKKYTTNYELIIIDNDSDSKTKDYISKLIATIIRNNKNMGFPYACNQGIKEAKNDYICFLNSDTIVTPDWMSKLQKCFELNPDCGMASPTTCYSNGKQCDRKLMDKRDSMSEQDILDYSGNLKEEYIQTEVYGFCMLTKKEILDKVGVFDWHRYGMGSTEEVDLQWRMEKFGYKSYWIKGAYVHHYGHKTFDELKVNADNLVSKNRAIFEKRKKDKNLFIENDVENGIREVKIGDNVSVLMPVLDRPKETKKTLEALFKNNNDINVIVIDNGSDNLDYLKKYDVKIIKNKKNLGIIKALNQGLKVANSKYIVCMHNDIVIHTKNWIKKAISFMDKNNKVGIVGAAGWKRLEANGEYHHLRTLINLYEKPPRKKFERVATIDGCLMIIRNLGLKFDERYGLFHMYDHDLCMQYRLLGYELFAMKGSAIHFADIRENSTVHTNKKYTSLRGKGEIAYYKERNDMFVAKWKDYLPVYIGEDK